MAKIKVIIKRPDEEIGHVTHISDSPENLQKTVGGPIRVLGWANFLLISRDPHSGEDLPYNCTIGSGFPIIPIRGTVIVTGGNAGHSLQLEDVPISLKFWKELIGKG